MKTERICGAVMILAAMFAVATGARAGEMTKSCTLSPKLPNPGPVDFALEPLVTGVFTCDIVTPSGYEFLGAGPPDITGEGFVWTQTGEWEFKVTNTKWESAHTRVSLTARWKLKSEEGEGGGGSGPGIISRTGVGDAYALEGELIVNADPAVVAVGAEATVSARASDSEYTPALSDWTLYPSPPAGFVGSWAGVSSVKVQQYVPGEAEVTAFYCQNPEKNAAANVTFVGVTSIEADPEVVCIGDDVSYTVTTQPAGHEAMVSYTPADTGTPGIKEVVAVCGSSSATCTVIVVKVASLSASPDVTPIGESNITYTITTEPAGHTNMVTLTPADCGTAGNNIATAVCGTSTATCYVTVVKVASLSASPDVTPIGNSNITYTVATDPADHTNMVTLIPADCGTAGSNIATAVCGASTATCYVTVFKVELDDTTAEILRGDTISTQVQFEPEGIAETIDLMPSGFDGIHLHASYNKTGRRLDIANLIDESALECWLDTAAIHVDAWANGVNWIDWTKNLLMKKELVEIWEDVKEKGADKLNDFTSPGDWAGEEVHDWLSDIFAVDSQGMVHWINPAAIDSAQLYARNTVNGLWTAFIREFIWSGIPTEDIEAAVVKETWEPEFDYDVELECAGGTISLDPHIEDLFTWIDSIGETGFSSETFSFQRIMLEASLSCDRETAEANVAAQMNIFLKYGNNVIDGETGQSYEGSVSFGVSVQIVFSFY